MIPDKLVLRGTPHVLRLGRYLLDLNARVKV